MNMKVLGVCGDNLTEDVDIGFLPPGDTGRQVAPCSCPSFRPTTHAITGLGAVQLLLIFIEYFNIIYHLFQDIFIL
jgi:hypothetical protein